MNVFTQNDKHKYPDMAECIKPVLYLIDSMKLSTLLNKLPQIFAGLEIKN